MMQLKRSAETNTLSLSTRRLDLGDNLITSSHCMEMVGDVLQTQLLTSITFRGCWLPNQVGRNLTYLIEGLSRSTSIELFLHEAITSAHTHYLVLLITTCPLSALSLFGMNVAEGFSLLAEAVKHATTLETLRLFNCNIGDRELMHLGRKARRGLVSLSLFTSSAVKRFLQYHYFSRLQVLDIGRPLNHEEKVVYNQLQLYRRQCNLPPLTIDITIEQLAEKMVQWEYFAPFSELSEAEQEEIRRNNERNYRAQKRAALYAWREKRGRQVTYRSFLSEVERVNELRSPGSVLDEFRQYLIKCYSSATHPSRDSWPFSDTSAYVDLPLFEAPLTQPKPGEGAQSPVPVDLNSIFLTGSHKAKRKVVLLEGVAGCGKTTLTWHACKEWAEGRLFQQFPLLIHVSLDDPAIRNATRLADIIPHPSSEMRKAVATAIARQRGKGVCFLLDGWDEASLAVQQRGSFIYEFLVGSTGQALPQCSIIVTSRPFTSGPLHRHMTCKVEIGRLNKRRMDNFIDLCLPPEGSDKLLKLFEKNPQLANLCNLPINLTMVIFLFRCGMRSLPETKTGLFKALVCNLLVRHMQLRTSYGLRKDEEFEDLPEDILKALKVVSSLAFTGIMQNRQVFELAIPSDTLSLMECHQQLTSFGPSNSHTCTCSFLDFSVQEFLAAWHMSKLGSEEQAKAVSDVLHSSPLSSVLPFFAGLAGLSNPAVRNVLLEVTKHPLDRYTVLVNRPQTEAADRFTGLSNPEARVVLLEVTKQPLDMDTVLANRPQTEAADRRRLALALVNCIYESQNSSLCDQVVCPSTPSPQYKTTISFQFLSLEPTDCLSIGYFLANHTSCFLDLRLCSIGDAGIEAVMMQLKRSAETNTLSLSTRRLDLGDNLITSSHCMEMVGDVLQTHLLTDITFHYCWLPNQVGRNLTYLIEGLSRRSTSIGLSLGEAITSAHTHYLVLLITTCPLNHLNLLRTNVGEGFSLLAEAVKQTTTLETLILHDCNIGNRELIHLGRKARISVRELVIVSLNPFTSSAVKRFLQYHYFSRLQKLDIGRPLNHEEKVVYNQLQLYRHQCNLPPLTIVDTTTRLYSAASTVIQTDDSLPKQVRGRRKE